MAFGLLFHAQTFTHSYHPFQTRRIYLNFSNFLSSLKKNAVRLVENVFLAELTNTLALALNYLEGGHYFSFSPVRHCGKNDMNIVHQGNSGVAYLEACLTCRLICITLTLTNVLTHPFPSRSTDTLQKKQEHRVRNVSPTITQRNVHALKLCWSNEPSYQGYRV